MCTRLNRLPFLACGESEVTDPRRVSDTDDRHYEIIRRSVVELMIVAGSFLRESSAERVLDIAPQDHRGIGPYAPTSAQIVTLDLDAASGADIIADICETNRNLLDGFFDAVICTEVLEHVSNPFAAVQELRRVLRPGGRLFASSPFDFRIHGPLPDNWRFSEHGWKQLLRDFSSVQVSGVDNPDRFLMPIHCSVIAIK